MLACSDRYTCRGRRLGSDRSARSLGGRTHCYKRFHRAKFFLQRQAMLRALLSLHSPTASCLLQMKRHAANCSHWKAPSNSHCTFVAAFDSNRLFQPLFLSHGQKRVQFLRTAHLTTRHTSSFFALFCSAFVSCFLDSPDR